MPAPKYAKPERIWLKTHADLNENWLQDRIGEDPSLLGLGDLVLKDRERPQPRAGRLDLLLQDVEANRRYEVEIQLGKTDESHIIRTIEYWDIERKRYPAVRPRRRDRGRGHHEPVPQRDRPLQRLHPARRRSS